MLVVVVEIMVTTRIKSSCARKRAVAILFFMVGFLGFSQLNAQNTTADLINDCRYWGATGSAKIDACSALYENGRTDKWLFLIYGELLDQAANFSASSEVYASGNQHYPDDQELKSLLSISQSKVNENEWRKQKDNTASAANNSGLNDVALQIRCQLAKDSGLSAPEECGLSIAGDIQPEPAAAEKNEPQEIVVAKASVPVQQAQGTKATKETEVKRGVSAAESAELNNGQLGSELRSLKEQLAKLKSQIDQSSQKSIARAAPTDKRRRVALVIGNGNYQHAGALMNTLNDANGVGQVLRQANFEVTVKTDIQDVTEFIEIVREYYKMLAQDRQTVGLFYYAGHAVQVDGINYLIPVASDIKNRADLSRTALSLSYVSDIMAEADNTMNMFVIDACRNNPFRSLSRSIQGGLANVNAPVGSLIVYAAGPGRVAMDGEGGNSPFTKSLIKHLNSPNKHVLLMLQDVIKDVRDETQGFQQPWVQSSLSGDFFFQAE